MHSILQRMISFFVSYNTNILKLYLKEILFYQHFKNLFMHSILQRMYSIFFLCVSYNTKKKDTLINSVMTNCTK